MGKRVQRREIDEVQPLAPPADDVPCAGDHVWFANRSHGRTTEHLATVTGGEGDTLDLQVVDQGVAGEFVKIKPWGPDSLMGWWRI